MERTVKNGRQRAKKKYSYAIRAQRSARSRAAKKLPVRPRRRSKPFDDATPTRRPADIAEIVNLAHSAPSTARLLEPIVELVESASQVLNFSSGSAAPVEDESPASVASDTLIDVVADDWKSWALREGYRESGTMTSPVCIDLSDSDDEPKKTILDRLVLEEIAAEPSSARADEDALKSRHAERRAEYASKRFAAGHVVESGAANEYFVRSYVDAAAAPPRPTSFCVRSELERIANRTRTLADAADKRRRPEPTDRPTVLVDPASPYRSQGVRSFIYNLSPPNRYDPFGNGSDYEFVSVSQQSSNRDGARSYARDHDVTISPLTDPRSGFSISPISPECSYASPRSCSKDVPGRPSCPSVGFDACARRFAPDARHYLRDAGPFFPNRPNVEIGAARTTRYRCADDPYRPSTGDVRPIRPRDHSARFDDATAERRRLPYRPVGVVDLPRFWNPYGTPETSRTGPSRQDARPLDPRETPRWHGGEPFASTGPYGTIHEDRENVPYAISPNEYQLRKRYAPHTITSQDELRIERTIEWKTQQMRARSESLLYETSIDPQAETPRVYFGTYKRHN